MNPYATMKVCPWQVKCVIINWLQKVNMAKALISKCTTCAGAAGEPFEKCTVCYESSNTKYCKECDGYYLRADKLGCVTTCNSLANSYLNLEGTVCVSSCAIFESLIYHNVWLVVKQLNIKTLIMFVYHALLTLQTV